MGYARILNLHYQGYSTSEICGRLKITPNNLYVLLLRARSMLENWGSKMKSACVKARLGNMLHAYELGMLSDEDRAEFEQHLLVCEYCFLKVQSFQDSSHILRTAGKARDVIDRIAQSQPTARKSTSEFTIALIAAAVVFIGLPLVWLGISDPEEAAEVQLLNLFPLRNAASNVISLETGGTDAIKFVYKGTVQGNAYGIEVVAEDGRIVYSEDDFHELNSLGLGKVILPLDIFAQGLYVFRISDPSELLVVQKYNFRVM